MFSPCLLSVNETSPSNGEILLYSVIPSAGWITQILVIGHVTVYVPAPVLTWKFRTTPSSPGNTWIILQTFQLTWIGLGSATMTKSLTLTFLLCTSVDFFLCSSRGKAFRNRLFQNVSTIFWQNSNLCRGFCVCGEIGLGKLFWFLFLIGCHSGKCMYLRQRQDRSVFCQWTSRSLNWQLPTSMCKAREV